MYTILTSFIQLTYYVLYYFGNSISKETLYWCLKFLKPSFLNSSDLSSDGNIHQLNVADIQTFLLRLICRKTQWFLTAEIKSRYEDSFCVIDILNRLKDLEQPPFLEFFDADKLLIWIDEEFSHDMDARLVSSIDIPNPSIHASFLTIKDTCFDLPEETVSKPMISKCTNSKQDDVDNFLTSDSANVAGKLRTASGKNVYDIFCQVTVARLSSILQYLKHLLVLRRKTDNYLSSLIIRKCSKGILVKYLMYCCVQHKREFRIAWLKYCGAVFRVIPSFKQALRAVMYLYYSVCAVHNRFCLNEKFFYENTNDIGIYQAGDMDGNSIHDASMFDLNHSEQNNLDSFLENSSDNYLNSKSNHIRGNLFYRLFGGRGKLKITNTDFMDTIPFYSLLYLTQKSDESRICRFAHFSMCGGTKSIVDRKLACDLANIFFPIKFHKTEHELNLFSSGSLLFREMDMLVQTRFRFLSKDEVREYAEILEKRINNALLNLKSLPSVSIKYSVKPQYLVDLIATNPANFSHLFPLLPKYSWMKAVERLIDFWIFSREFKRANMWLYFLLEESVFSVRTPGYEVSFCYNYTKRAKWWHELAKNFIKLRQTAKALQILEEILGIHDDWTKKLVKSNLPCFFDCLSRKETSLAHLKFSTCKSAILKRKRVPLSSVKVVATESSLSFAEFHGVDILSRLKILNYNSSEEIERINRLMRPCWASSDITYFNLLWAAECRLFLSRTERFSMEKLLLRLHIPPRRWRPIPSYLMSHTLCHPERIILYGVRDSIISRNWCFQNNDSNESFDVEEFARRWRLQQLNSNNEFSWSAIHCEGRWFQLLMEILLVEAVCFGRSPCLSESCQCCFSDFKEFYLTEDFSDGSIRSDKDGFSDFLRMQFQNYAWLTSFQSRPLITTGMHWGLTHISPLRKRVTYIVLQTLHFFATCSRESFTDFVEKHVFSKKEISTNCYNSRGNCLDSLSNQQPNNVSKTPIEGIFDSYSSKMNNTEKLSDSYQDISTNTDFQDCYKVNVEGFPILEIARVVPKEPLCRLIWLMWCGTATNGLFPTSSGFPDLCFWSRDMPYSNSENSDTDESPTQISSKFFLSEVKSPNDVCSDRQVIMHDLLLQCGFSVEILQVRIHSNDV